ncbi:Transcription factor [Akanthomyces lecanii RCEF 1005]|uniref:Transcription factor n=1 Tax=Akanthomyces lecanii RCEF 1005 TaxID=1081108 RepID=A0A168JE73_CORDF|nr:Transcription factor [Akanthomyces lecanii RCEF 1005]
MNYSDDLHKHGNSERHEPPATALASPPLQERTGQAIGRAIHTASQPRSFGNATIYHTAGPDAHTSAITSPGGSTTALNPRSCVTCRRRRVRCDKQMPCSNCRRAKTPCIFPAPGRAARRQKSNKDPDAPPRSPGQREVELTTRLRKLECIVEELSGQIAVDSGSSRLAHLESPQVAVGGDGVSQGSGTDFFGRPATEGVDETNADVLQGGDVGQQLGRMVIGDHKGTVRYVSSGFWSKMNDEVSLDHPSRFAVTDVLTSRQIDDIRAESQRLSIDDDDNVSDYNEYPIETTESLETLHDHPSFFLGFPSVDADLTKLYPYPPQATFLWSIYKENVEPLVKILHIPTVEPLLREARKDATSLSPANEALAFAIYFSALTALEPEEVQTNFRAAKSTVLAQYRFAVEQALARANLLDTSDITVLQAFTLYLLISRRPDTSRFCWALTSLVVRLAQGMGLHRDGSHIGLSPFETEIRRRLWWAILTLDLRSAEDLGTGMVIPDDEYDTKMPLNINDADICLESTDFPEPREGRSDCAVALVRFELCSMARRIYSTSSTTALRSDKSSLDRSSTAEKEQMIIKVYQRIEENLFRHVVDEASPLCWAVAMITRLNIAKTCLDIYYPLLLPGAKEQLPCEARQRLFVAAIEIMECNHKLGTDARYKQYRWLFKTYTVCHAVTHVLVEICRRSWTALIERAWQAVTPYGGVPAELEKKADYAAVFIPLRRMFARARKHRATEIARLRADPEEARRLDSAERMDPETTRFGPVPGAEHIMDEARERWRLLLQSEGASTTPCFDPQAAVGNLHSTTEEFPQEAQLQNVPPAATLLPQCAKAVSSGGVDYTLSYVDVRMPHHNEPVTDFWDIGNMNPAAALNRSAQQELQNSGLDMQPLGGTNTQPHLWADTFSAPGVRLDDILANGGEIENDFDWQDWDQSISGLEMGSTQSQPPGPDQPWP